MTAPMGFRLTAIARCQGVPIANSMAVLSPTMIGSPPIRSWGRLPRRNPIALAFRVNATPITANVTA